MEHDMLDEESEALIDTLIERIGLDEAIRGLEARKAKAKRGRPVGLKYQQPDQQLLLLAGSLQFEWERRRPQCAPPSRHALLTKVVNLCCDYEAVQVFTKSFGLRTLREDRFSLFVRSKEGKRSIVSRLLSRLPTAQFYTSDDGIPFYAMEPCFTQQGVLGVLPPVEAWEAVHQLRPDLCLLPPTS